MNCYTSGLLGIGLLGATLLTISVPTNVNDNLKRELSPELAELYIKLSNERRNLYIQGLLLGLLLSYFTVKYVKPVNKFHVSTFFLAITISVSGLYYYLMPKSDYMLNHLKTESQNKAWLSVYNTMKHRYYLGFLFGALSSIPIAHSLCKL